MKPVDLVWSWRVHAVCTRGLRTLEEEITLARRE